MKLSKEDFFCPLKERCPFETVCTSFPKKCYACSNNPENVKRIEEQQTTPRKLFSNPLTKIFHREPKSIYKKEMDWNDF